LLKAYQGEFEIYCNVPYVICQGFKFAESGVFEIGQPLDVVKGFIPVVDYTETELGALRIILHVVVGVDEEVAALILGNFNETILDINIVAQKKIRNIARLPVSLV